MNKKVLSLLFTCGLFVNLFALENIVTSGIGSTEEEARASALNEMSHIFTVTVQSSTDARQSYSQSGNKSKTIKDMDMRILVKSDMELYGVTYKTYDNGKKGKEKEYTVEATLNPEKSIPLYEIEIKKLVEKIDDRAAALDKLPGSKEDQEYQSLYKDYSTFDKYEIILRTLGKENTIKPKLSSADFRIKYEQRAKENTSLEKAAEAIVTAVTLQETSKKSVYVNAAQFEGENTSTEFSVALANAVKAKLGKKLVLSKDFCDSQLTGSYYFAPGSVDGEDIIVTYYLTDTDGSILAASGMVKIPYRVYSEYKYIPRNYDLQKEIAAGRTSNPAFDVSIRINGDRNAQTFKNGDSLILEVRATQPCYIYVIGYVYNDEDEPFSYLFPLNPYGDGKEMFVKKLGTKDANNWVVINPAIDDEILNIEVAPPFGEETLYVYASTTADFDDFVKLIPSYTETDDYYLVGGTPVETVSKTRALNIKRVTDKAKQVVNTAESTISYLTRNK